MNQKTVFSILTTVILVASLDLIGCGADDNGQPSIEAITDKILEVGDKTTVDVNITDADLGDIHAITASSQDMTVATVSVNDTFLTITTKAAGIATIVVSATDDSGQDNAAATPVIFEVTVNPPSPQVTLGLGLNQPPSSLVDKGACVVGMTLKPGESCSYRSNEPFAEIIFSVLDDGSVCREQVPLLRGQLEIPRQFRPRNLKFCVEWNIGRDNFFETNFAASKNPDKSWTINSVP